MSRADYDYSINGNILVITDLNFGRMSVTNDIEYVIAEINTTLKTNGEPSISNYKVVYQDSEGVFDGIIINDKDEFEDFYGIREKEFEKAKQKIK